MDVPGTQMAIQGSPDSQTILVENLTDNEPLFALNRNKLMYYLCLHYQNKVKVTPFEWL